MVFRLAGCHGTQLYLSVTQAFFAGLLDVCHTVTRVINVINDQCRSLTWQKTSQGWKGAWQSEPYTGLCFVFSWGATLMN